jgi:hypothetical protein
MNAKSKRKYVSIVVIRTARIFDNSEQLQCCSTAILSCVLHSGNKTRTQSHFSAFEFLCSPPCRTHAGVFRPILFTHYIKNQGTP